MFSCFKQGSKVFVKHLNIKHCTVNRELLIELKQMKDLAHENLIRFVGICVDDQHISILTEYCEKGNLRVIFLFFKSCTNYK